MKRKNLTSIPSLRTSGLIDETEDGQESQPTKKTPHSNRSQQLAPMELFRQLHQSKAQGSIAKKNFSDILHRSKTHGSLQNTTSPPFQNVSEQMITLTTTNFRSHPVPQTAYQKQTPSAERSNTNLIQITPPVQCSREVQHTYEVQRNLELQQSENPDNRSWSAEDTTSQGKDQCPRYRRILQKVFTSGWKHLEETQVKSEGPGMVVATRNVLA